MPRRCSGLAALFVVACSAFGLGGEPVALTDLDVLAKALDKPIAIIQGKRQTFTATLTARYREGQLEQAAELAVTRLDARRFGLSLKSQLFSFVLTRSAEATRLVVPSKQVALVGKGPLPAHSALEPDELFLRMASAWPQVQTAVGVMLSADPGATALILQTLLTLERAAGKSPPTFVAKRGVGKGVLSIELSPDGQSIRQLAWRGKDQAATLGIALRDEAAMPAASMDGLKVVGVPRGELERTLGRGLAAAAHILAYHQQEPRLRDGVREAARGRLVVRKRTRLAMLEGSPYEVGFQHGKLLGREARRVCDAALYVVGLYDTLGKREWFLDTLRGAFKRLQPHIPAEYLEEMKGLADGSGISLEEVQLANAFPALFHCSGFALFGRATKDGKLYHGRVLDYMTEVGLQRDAVVFTVKKAGAIPFANVGYAGFIGCVSGMNAEGLAFGEMGGRGEGLWDGTPMPILMRMGLERARTLDDAIRIFREAKRTCEYYYVVSDGKGPSAVGIAATPDKIEFLRPGQAHPKLPEAVDDAVLMSAGVRYAKLVARVRAKHGQIDEKGAIDLMSAPVAMRSNLHNVLFLPEDLVFHVANARGRGAACGEPYVRYDLRAILAEMAQPPKNGQ